MKMEMLKNHKLMKVEQSMKVILNDNQINYILNILLFLFLFSYKHKQTKHNQ